MLRTFLPGLILLTSFATACFALTFDETLVEAQNDNPVAQFNIGLAYQTGDGVGADPILAGEWYGRAAELGYAPAMINLAFLSAERGEQVEALRLYTQAAELGEIVAQLEVAERYREGLGTNRDPIAAAQWYQRAAEQGDAGAMLILANMYADGEGVTRDYAHAADFYRMAAENGQIEAHCYLGRLYAEGGFGLPQDAAKALESFRAGAYKGEPVAQYNLAQYYALGQGVLKDQVKAYSWYKLAASQNIAAAQTALAKLQGTLTATELAMGDAEAGKLASQISAQPQ
jgi:uncharacterized protein